MNIEPGRGAYPCGQAHTKRSISIMKNNILILALVMLSVFPAYANPIYIEVSPIPGTGPLLLESLAIALGSRFIGLRTFRTLIFWLIVTHLTFFPAKWLFETTPEDSRLVNLILLETAIVLIEALVLRWWIKKEIGKTKVVFPVVLVFFGNLVSFATGLTPINTNYVGEWHLETIKLGFGLTPQVLVALLAETIVISTILLKWKFDFIRFIYSWIFIALISYWLFIISYAELGDLRSIIYFPDKAFVIVLEAIFALIEAKVIWILSKHGFYRNQEAPFNKRVAISVSIAGNLISAVICHEWIFYN